MNIVEELEQLIMRLGSGKEKESTYQEARRFLLAVDPVLLRDAERQLMEKGISVEKLHNLCAIHLEIFDEDETPRHSAAAAGSGIVDVLYHEHEIILDLLEQLEGIGHVLQGREIASFHSREIAGLPAIVDSLTNIESHRQREEQVIFAELEHAKVKCPSRILSAEHKRLGDEVAHLTELLRSTTTDIERFRQKAVMNINVIVPIWWRHIFKENNILFPSFIEHVVDEHRLAEAKSLCDKIGYAGLLTAQLVGHAGNER
jgi:uncharacterized protein